MALNPFFLQGSSSEQRLVQDLVNEHLRIYGVEVIYIPRKFVNKKTVIEEVQSSRFDDNYAIEAYVNTYDGYSGAGDILTKFGMSLRDELLITISKERFEDFIAPFLGAEDDGTGEGEIILSTRPREGDLIYFPLGQRIFEVKFVEHESPFYQLGKNYVYELKCELFEYEDEIIDTSINEIDTQVEDEGYITTLKLIGVGRTATAISFIGGIDPGPSGVTINSGYIREIFLNNDGYGYTSRPVVAISTSPVGGDINNATAVAITTSKGGIYSVERIYLTNAGAGYTVPPTITISGGGGVGAAATCSIETTYNGLMRIVITDGGVGYGTAPVVTIAHPSVGAAATASIGVGGTVNSVTITNPGTGYTGTPTITVSSPPTRTGVISTSTLYNAGSGYSLGQYTISPYSGVVGVGGSQAVIEVTSINGSGGITGFSTTYGGHSYESNDYYRLNGGNNLGIIRIITTTTGIGITATVDATISGGVVDSLAITNPGSGYTVAPTITISNDDSIKDSVLARATGIASMGVEASTNVVRSIWISNPGLGYTSAPTITIASPEGMTGIGTYLFNEIVIGSRSQTRARVKSWDKDTNILEISNVGIGRTQLGFFVGEAIIGTESGAIYSVDPLGGFNQMDTNDKYSQNDEIEEEADLILDFSESNPFGNY